MVGGMRLVVVEGCSDMKYRCGSNVVDESMMKNRLGVLDDSLLVDSVPSFLHSHDRFFCSCWSWNSFILNDSVGIYYILYKLLEYNIYYIYTSYTSILTLWNTKDKECSLINNISMHPKRTERCVHKKI